MLDLVYLVSTILGESGERRTHEKDGIPIRKVELRVVRDLGPSGI